MKRRPLWQCPRCTRRFANRNQSHSCAELKPLDAHFEGATPKARAIFDAFRNALDPLGPFVVLPEKTRIAFQSRISFAQLSPRKQWVDGHVVLSRRVEHDRFRRIESISPRNHVHHFRLFEATDVDAWLAGVLAEAYGVGDQHHLGRPAGSPVHALVGAMRKRLRQGANPTRAVGAQAYMKSAMPFLGLDAKALRTACKEAFRSHALPDPGTWRSAVLTLWREATHREERYAAIELTGARGYRDAPFQTLDDLPMYEEMIVSGAWWDYVDVLAVHRVGEYLLRREPARMHRILGSWAKGVDIWKRRSAILSQITFKADTDLAFLEACITPSMDRSEFWLRKAIGWALRQHAWTDPKWVVAYVDRNAARLSPLSRREALKNIAGRS